MKLGADHGTSDGALLDHATVVVLLGLTDGAATDGIMMVLCLAWSSVQTMERQMVPCLAMLLLMYCFVWPILVMLLVLLLMAS